MTEKKPSCYDLILPVGFIKQAGGMIVMVAKLREINLLPGRVSGRSFSLQSAPLSFSAKEYV